MSEQSQSVTDVRLILNQPTSLLVDLARTDDLEAQRKLVQDAGKPALLESMALPPPSPTTVLRHDQRAAQASVLAEEHPALSILLGQAFEPPLLNVQGAGLLALAAIEPENRFQPIFTSIDEFSFSAAQEQVSTAVSQEGNSQTAVSRDSVSALASQIKTWALEQQTSAVTHQIDSSRDIAIALAARAAHEGRLPQQDLLENEPRPFELYASAYRDELEALASGYYTQLHQNAATKLGLPSSTSTRASPDQQDDGANSVAKRVQAAAAAALAAHSLAANEMIAEVESQDYTLSELGITGPQAGLTRLVVRPDELQSDKGGGSRSDDKQAATAPHSIPQPERSFATDSKTQQGRATELRERDQLLAYAHDLYCREPQNESLLPLLHALRSRHPQHLPVLLLISCVYYVRGDLDGSLVYNRQILDIEPNYVEAMSNIGTTLRALGRWQEAEQWWWQAIQIRPTYWDATENLLGVLCHPPPEATIDGPEQHARLNRALAVCQVVESRLFGTGATKESAHNGSSSVPRPLRLPSTVPASQAHRLLNFYYAKGNILSSLGSPSDACLDEYIKGLEIAFSSANLQLDMSTILLGATVVAIFISSAIQRDAKSTTMFTELSRLLEVNGHTKSSRTSMPPDWLSHVHLNSSQLGSCLVRYGGGIVPTIFLRPHALSGFLSLFLADFDGKLPCLGNGGGNDMGSRSRAAHQTVSTLLLTVAKVIQDGLSTPGSNRSLGSLPFSPSLLLPIYYLALSFWPSPSTCNNLGILLSTINTSVVLNSDTEQVTVLSGQQLALEYYRAGLIQDPKHAHLYTNYGSLLKDMGHLAQAIDLYKKAVEFNPNFDVALANLANAVKDNGQIQDSIPYYRRAVALNPNFPEAICGLVNALGGVCDWTGRGFVDGDNFSIDSQGLVVPLTGDASSWPTGYMNQIKDLIDLQLKAGSTYGSGSFRSFAPLQTWVETIAQAITGRPEGLSSEAQDAWTRRLTPFFLESLPGNNDNRNEGSYLIRLVERLMRRVQWRWYHDREAGRQAGAESYTRPMLPPSLSLAPVSTVLPFHTFTLPVDERQTRLISHRTGLRISQTQLTQPWMPASVFEPPARLAGQRLRIGYVSSDLGNHPLSHLMQSVFGLHDRTRFRVFCYATSPSDSSSYRKKIEEESDHFRDCSSLSTEAVVSAIVADEIHILLNLSGYTKGARNEIFAARPAPLQMSYMGFAGTLSAGWCDYFIVDPVVCPPSLVSGNLWRQRVQEGISQAPERLTDFEGDLDPESLSQDFVYSEKLIYMPHSYFVTDHKQAWHEDDHSRVQVLPSHEAWVHEEVKRHNMRKTLFPDLPSDHVIFANWNQLYKIDPFIFRIWLDILAAHPKSILWLLRFPAAGEQHLKNCAMQWAGAEVASRIVFTDVASKAEHVHRGRVADLFLDTTECNAHTTAADILYSGTPIITWPRHRHKLCSRVAASIALATGHGPEMIAMSAQQYTQLALDFAASVSSDKTSVPDHLVDLCGEKTYQRGKGRLNELRRMLFLERDRSPLFDTKRWVRNVEQGLEVAWDRWTSGAEFEDGQTWTEGPTRRTGCIWVSDDIDGTNEDSRRDYM